MKRRLKEIYEYVMDFLAESPDYNECSDKDRNLLEELANVRDTIGDYLAKQKVTEEDGDELEISKCLTISTAHISEETAALCLKQMGFKGEEKIQTFPIPIYRKDEFSWVFYLPDNVLDMDKELPSDLCKCIKLAAANGCCWLCLDSDGSTVTGIRQYNW